MLVALLILGIMSALGYETYRAGRISAQRIPGPREHHERRAFDAIRVFCTEIFRELRSAM